MQDKITNLEKYKDLYTRYKNYIDLRIPLCAAENYTSDIVNKALFSIWNGKYCLSNEFYNESMDFVGSKYIHELLTITTDQCNKVFNAKYSNPKTLTGMNCFTVTVMSCMSLLKNHKALVTLPNCGGHASIPTILTSIGFEVYGIPYNYQKYDIDYEQTNMILKEKEYGLIVISLSDLLQQPDINKLDISQDTIIIFDATQTLGIIAAKLCDNPLLSKHHKVLLIGGTHKTLPGPSCGLIMANNEFLYRNIENNISPIFLRDFQPNNVAGLLMTLIEAEIYGEEYQKKIISTANSLADKLHKRGFHVASLYERYTNTHQIFLLTSKNDMETIYNNSIKYGVTLNKKHKKLFNGYGIRLGVQEIARYSWNDNDLELLAIIIEQLRNKAPNNKQIVDIITILSNKKVPNYILS